MLKKRRQPSLFKVKVVGSEENDIKRQNIAQLVFLQEGIGLKWITKGQSKKW
jgi:hypothetical protein